MSILVPGVHIPKTIATELKQRFPAAPRRQENILAGSVGSTQLEKNGQQQDPVLNCPNGQDAPGGFGTHTIVVPLTTKLQLGLGDGEGDGDGAVS